MKNIAVILISILLAGCPMGDRSPKYAQADAVVVNDKVCVFIKKENLVAQEKLLRVSIMKAGDEKMSYEKQFYSPVISIDLKSGECILGLSDFNYETGYSYDINIQTSHNNYQTGFILWKYGQSLKLK
ncbi:putative T6SS immunity periplasmic lipoprotein [Buttiauxella sp.]|uniref:putative T6SS immunity periplasmic lipoprotein n=1 Tax=Buttiauxella sp. TaxID=1972222 RepID=UPI003C716518